MQQGSSSGAGDSGGMFTGLEGGDRSSVKSTNAPALPALRLAAAGKKAKGAAQGYSPPPPMPPPMSPKCQVEGCDLDLKGAKSYYCRHKVCGMHSKSPKVIVAGLEQRFCQQCSRFHLLKEFDQGKRSCRRRLAGHNERRRKPPPPELLPSHFDQLPSFPDVNSNCHGGYVLNFIQPGPPEITRANTLWPSRRSGDLFSGSDLALGNCIAGVSDSACALSLLSDQLLGESPDSISSPIDPQPPVIVPSRDAASRHQEARSNSSHEVGLRPPVQDADEIDQFAGIDVASIDVASIDVASIDVASEVYDHLHDFHWLL